MHEKIHTSLNQLLSEIIERNLNREIVLWLIEEASRCSEVNDYEFNNIFATIPRKTGKREVILEITDSEEINYLVSGYSIQGWSIDRLSRVWLLLQLDASNKKTYICRIKNLFPYADINEQVTLYSSLPLFFYPEEWIMQCAIGIRSNIDSVLESIMYNNPYPAAYLDDHAWNQLVLKALFTQKDISRIVGLDERANEILAVTLFDYIKERLSAHRTVPHQIWRLIGKYLDESHLKTVKKVFAEGSKVEQHAVALACAESPSEDIRIWLDRHVEFKKAIQENKLTWKVVGEEE